MAHGEHWKIYMIQIGASNFYSDRLIDICSFSRIAPMVNQVEIHPFTQRIEDQKWMEKYKVQPEAWAPFAEGKNGIFTNPSIAEIGKKYNKSVAQVILSFVGSFNVELLLFLNQSMLKE